ncbi:hypothetical protein LCGC14_0363620 [marine sediment metagenome]|uniref:Uncharacterized protein n=1 Tax=marine sediment metagenome TaxID=412755 RepID=A0A0F9T7H4_9ZZZZ
MEDEEAFSLINQMIGMLHSNYHHNKKRDLKLDQLDEWTKKLIKKK